MERRSHILLVDADDAARGETAARLTEVGYRVTVADDAASALELHETLGSDLVLVDAQHAELASGHLIARLRELADPPPVVVIAGEHELPEAIEALRCGATDHVMRPIDATALRAVVQRTLDARDVEQETRRLRQEARATPPRRELVGTTPAMVALDEAIDVASTSRATVLILGESGTGKELVATAIHERGGRADGPMIKVHCAALTESLLESELFGHEKGSFTGAIARRAGRFELAHHGTLFLDEIGEIPPSVQVKLLRVLQEHAFERVGGNETIRVDVRVIAATNRDLRRMVAEGRFREDLYYRLAVLPIDTPSLRDRREDIPVLAHRFLAQAAARESRDVTHFSPDAMQALLAYRWPGNVRELEHAVERAVVMTARGPEVGLEALPPEVGGSRPASHRERPRIPGATLADLERYAILTTVEAMGGSTSRAAQLLGMSTRKVQYRLQSFSGAPRRGVAILRPEDGPRGG